MDAAGAGGGFAHYTTKPAPEAFLPLTMYLRTPAFVLLTNAVFSVPGPGLHSAHVTASTRGPAALRSLWFWGAS